MVKRPDKQNFGVTYKDKYMECRETDEKAAKEQAKVLWRLVGIPGVNSKIKVEKIRRIT